MQCRKLATILWPFLPREVASRAVEDVLLTLLACPSPNLSPGMLLLSISKISVSEGHQLFRPSPVSPPVQQSDLHSPRHLQQLVPGGHRQMMVADVTLKTRRETWWEIVGG